MPSPTLLSPMEMIRSNLRQVSWHEERVYIRLIAIKNVPRIDTINVPSPFCVTPHCVSQPPKVVEWVVIILIPTQDIRGMTIPQIVLLEHTRDVQNMVPTRLRTQPLHICVSIILRVELMPIPMCAFSP